MLAPCAWSIKVIEQVKLQLENLHLQPEKRALESRMCVEEPTPHSESKRPKLTQSVLLLIPYQLTRGKSDQRSFSIDPHSKLLTGTQNYALFNEFYA